LEMNEKKKRNDDAIRELVPTKVRVVVQSRARGRGASYTQVPGHSVVVDVRNLREFRRFWRGVSDLATKGGWRDAVRPSAAGHSLPVAGVPPTPGVGVE
jgi:hypothetical protein